MARGKLIAVSGPPGCGKTTLTLNLAQKVHELTKEKILYISPDTLIPAMSLVFPRRDKEDLRSLGKALENVNLAITDILGVIATTDAMPNLGYTGYVAGEGPYSYVALQEKKVMELVDILRDNFDYIFVDCVRDREDMISSIVCGLCDHLIQIVNPDIKSVAYYGFEPIRDEAIQVLMILDADIYLPIQEIRARFPKLAHTVLYSRAAKMQMVEGCLMDYLNDSVYQKAIKPILDILMAEPEVPEEAEEDNSLSETPLK